jgi:hypothetical protein
METEVDTHIEHTSPSHTPSLIEIVERYIDRGWAPIPVAHRAKRPVGAGWTTLKLRREDVPAHFGAGPMNIGILLGGPSNDLVDVDVDDMSAVKIAKLLLPDTESIFGRASKPRSHWLYYAQTCRAQKSNLHHFS